MIRRCVDIVFSMLGLLVLIPVFLVIAVVIKFDSAGPVLFLQRRVGLSGRIFRILKFRSMSHRVGGDRSGVLVTSRSDSRITRVGGVLRRYKLDELPQFWNVLVGDMSLIGPRPEVERYVELWPADLRKIVLSVRPGISDPTALEFFDEEVLLSGSSDPEREYIETLIPKKLAGYIAYIKNRSFRGDCRVMAATLLRAAFGAK